jgi:hypothetical protein
VYVYNKNYHSNDAFFFQAADCFSFADRQTDSIATSYRLDGQNQIPVGKRYFPLLPNAQIGPKTHLTSYLINAGVLS